MSPAPVKLAIVGATGFIGHRHWLYASESREIELVAAIDPAPAAKALAEQQNAAVFDDLGTFLDAVDAGLKVDGVVLATPTHTHVPLGVRLLAAGIHCLVEKPISGDSASARELVTAARTSKGSLLIGHHRRFNSHLIAAKSLVASGALGKVLAISCIWALVKPKGYYDIDWHRAVGAGGPILTNLIHEIDNLHHLVGDITRVHVEEGVKTRGYDVEETAAFVLRFSSGAVGTIVLSDATVSPYNFEGSTGENHAIAHTGEPSLMVMGTSGSFALPELTRFHYDGIPAADAHWGASIQRDPAPAQAVDNSPPLARQLEHFVRVIRGEEKPNCTAEDGLKALLVLEAMFQSRDLGAPVDVARV